MLKIKITFNGEDHEITPADARKLLAEETMEMPADAPPPEHSPQAGVCGAGLIADVDEQTAPFLLYCVT